MSCTPVSSTEAIRPMSGTAVGRSEPLRTPHPAVGAVADLSGRCFGRLTSTGATQMNRLDEDTGAGMLTPGETAR
jgi:hypothetical protein